MTNKEAIEVIKGLGLPIDAFYTKGKRRNEVYEALKLAIKALEGQEQSKKHKCPNYYNCGDCVHTKYVWEGVTFRGIRCLKGCG